MMILRTALTRTSLARTQPKMLSTQAPLPAVGKLRDILEEYRLKHFTQEIPSRFKKEIARAAARKAQPGTVCKIGIKRVLNNIGAQDRLNEAEIETIFQEYSNETGEIPSHTLTRIL